MFPQLASGQRHPARHHALEEGQMPDTEGRPPPGSDPDARRTASQISCNQRSEGQDSLSSTVFLGVSLARRLTVRNLLLRVAACLPVRGVACATGGGSQAACVCRGSSSSTRRRSAAIISSPSFSDSIYWLSLFVCVSAQVMDGTSAVSGHLGDVVLWERSPPAAGEVLIRARTPGRPPAAVVRELAQSSHDRAHRFVQRA